MRRLSAEQILQVWEQGQHQHPIDRALTLLALALPAQSYEELSCLSIGERDALLLLMRQQMLGETIESVAYCPNCGESLEFTLKTTELYVVKPVLERPKSQPHHVWEMADYVLTFTVPNSQDLAAIVDCDNLLTAQSILMQRCVHEACYEGVEIAPETLPDNVLQQLSQQMTEADPQAEVLLDLICPACQTDWLVLFDVVAFFWTELGIQAQQLMQEVYVLARNYGWHEADILAMSAMRRQSYLGMVEV
jgi:hypothetical protein